MINYEKIKEEHKKVSSQLSQEGIYNDQELYQTLTKRFSFLEKIIKIISEREKTLEGIEHLKAVISDSKEEKEMKELAQQELTEAKSKLTVLEDDIEEMFFEKEDDSERDVIIEIRPAAGGEEAAIFAADLFKMYTKYVEGKGWKLVIRKGKQAQLELLPEVIDSVSKEDADFDYFIGIWKKMNDPLKGIIEKKAEAIAKQKNPHIKSKLSVQYEIVEIMRQRENKPEKEEST